MPPRRKGEAVSRLSALALAACCLWSPMQVATTAEPYSEAAVKAAFLYRFAGYVEWPAAGPSGPPLIIAVLDDTPVADQLDAAVAKQASTARPTQVVRIAKIADLGDAHVLFVGGAARNNLRHVISTLASRPVLVVTDAERGLDLGATINFRVVDRHVRFEVSVAAARRANLKISSDLLSVAVRVVDGDP